jgi:hypothetical protein
MTTPVKLAAFAADLAVIFGAAALTGGAIGRIHDPATASAFVVSNSLRLRRFSSARKEVTP